MSRRVDIAHAYDARAEEYVDEQGSVDRLAERDRSTIEQWRDGRDGRLLDAGCGPGHWTDLLADGGRRDVLGLDTSRRFLESARRRFPGSWFVAGDLARLPIGSRSLGGILAWYLIIHTPPADLPQVLAELARTLAPSGSLLLGFVDGEPGTAFDHVVTTAYHWDAEALTELLRPLGLVVEHTATRRDPGARRAHGELRCVRSP